MESNINEQALAFDRVLPWEGQVEAVSKTPDGKVWLKFAAPDAQRVSVRIQEEEYLCENENGIWKLEYPFRTGFHYVQLLIDGTEVLTPLLPIGYGYSRPYNYVALDVPEDDFLKIKDVAHGTVRREYFKSSVTGEWESMLVYTPYEYDENPQKEYPVLYLQHGHGENEVGWVMAGKVNFIMDNLLAAGKAVPFIIVMSNGMVQEVTKEGERRVNFHLFEKQLLQDIIPYVEGRFRVCRNKNGRAMAGLSMGSLQTSMIGLSHPEMFAYLGVFSGFVTDIITGSPLDTAHNEPGGQEHLQLLNDAKKCSESFKVFFRSMGRDDSFWDTFAKDDELLKEKGICSVRKIYDGGHDWNVWRQSIRDFAQLLFR